MGTDVMKCEVWGNWSDGNLEMPHQRARTGLYTSSNCSISPFSFAEDFIFDMNEPIHIAYLPLTLVRSSQGGACIAHLGLQTQACLPNAFSRLFMSGRFLIVTSLFGMATVVGSGGALYNLVAYDQLDPLISASFHC